MNNRIKYIDFLKFIGLTGILIAHVGSPDWLLMLRSFDVPLMVILSSLLAYTSYNKHNSKNIITYYIHRFKRLVIPVWIFLLIYFLTKYILSGDLNRINYYIASFFLTRYGIGYVWIFLIYLYSAMLVPFFNKTGHSLKWLIVIVLSYILYELACYFEIGTQYKILDTTFFYIIPYGILTYLGYNYSKYTLKTKYTIAISSFLIFVALAVYYWVINGSPQYVQIAKYPPRLYYLCYGITCSFGMLIFCEKHYLKLYDNRLIIYISNHSMWIYLWHILLLTTYKAMHLPEIWYIKLFSIYLVAILMVFVINKLLDYIDSKHKFIFLNYLRG